MCVYVHVSVCVSECVKCVCVDGNITYTYYVNKSVIHSVCYSFKH